MDVDIIVARQNVVEEMYRPETRNAMPRNKMQRPWRIKDSTFESLEFALAAVSNHVCSPETNESPPIHFPTSPETFQTLPLDVTRLK